MLLVGLAGGWQWRGAVPFAADTGGRATLRVDPAVEALELRVLEPVGPSEAETIGHAVLTVRSGAEAVVPIRAAAGR
jgi:hypothetical protein